MDHADEDAPAKAGESHPAVEQSFHHNGHERLVCIACDNCEAEGPCFLFRGDYGQLDYDKARRAWNKRPQQIDRTSVSGGTTDA